MENPAFRHQALIYAGADEFLAGTVPFLWAALEAEEPVLVAVRQTQAELLEAELGGEAGWVEFMAIEPLARNPAALIPLWRSFVEENGGRPVRGISEPAWPGRSPAALEECHRHESLINLAFPGNPPFSLLCPFDASAVPAAETGRIAASHRYLTRGVSAEESADFDPRQDGLGGGLPPPPAWTEAVGFELRDLAEVRRRVALAAERAGLDPRGAADLVTAASELAANSVLYGGGAGTLRIWREDRTLLTEVRDRGRIEEPLVGRLRPEISQEGGRGLWLANQLCELVQIRSGESGTAVRLHMSAGDCLAWPERSSPAPDPRTEPATSNA